MDRFGLTQSDRFRVESPLILHPPLRVRAFSSLSSNAPLPWPSTACRLSLPECLHCFHLCPPFSLSATFHYDGSISGLPSS
ncbi:hypothetical protein S83_068833 [Arachis hypogaea]